MKNVILLFVLFCTLTLAQGWNSIVTTTINEPSLSKMDLFTNKDGNHILIQRSNGTIIYYNTNSSGTVISSKTETLVTGGDFPNIIGSNEKIYAIYKAGNYIKGKYSTNGGADWSSIPNKAITSNICNGIDAVYQNNYGVHVVWATKDSNPNYETHYYRLNTSNSWVDYKNVTDHSSLQYGGFPTVSVSENRVHVSVNTGQSSDPTTNVGVAKTRDKYYSTWQTPQTIFDQGSMVEKIGNSNSKLFNFYYKFVEDMGYHADLYVKQRTLGGTSWSSGTLLHSWAGIEPVVSITNTSDNKSHIVYEGPSSVLYRNYNGSSWSASSTIASDGYYNPVISSVSNDLYVTYKSDNSSYIKYRQYDANPLAPQNLTVVWYNNHPKLTWNSNNEPDMQSYKIWKHAAGSSMIAATVTHNSSNSAHSWIDNSVSKPGKFDPKIEYSYKVKAVDNSNKSSLYSNQVSIIGNGFIWKINDEDNDNESKVITKYSLNQNYPNPFNPTTTISFQLPESGYTTLKVYNNLGEEVEELENSFKNSGNYSISFDASNLPSGVYFYKLQSGSFTQVNKMILLR